MHISSAITFLVASLIASASAAIIPCSDVTYKVIAAVPSNETVGVVVDDTVYPLTSTSKYSTLLHIGEAPMASSGYQYAILNKANNEIIRKENFIRQPVDDSTLNEVYDRSWNTKSLVQLPTIMKPLPIIHRIKSSLHVDGQIPVIHITGNQTAVDYIHNHRAEDIEITMNMTYISPNKIKTFKEITMAISGCSTRLASKLSYKIKMPEGKNLYGYRTVKLRSMAFDLTYMKEELAYNIAESVGLATTKYSYVRVYINDKPIGLFGLAEAFKGPWIRNEFANGNKKYKQGALYIADMNGGAACLANQLNAPSHNSTAQHNEATVNRNTKRDVAISTHPSPDLSYLGTNLTVYSHFYLAKDKSYKGTTDYAKLMKLTKFISKQPNNITLTDAVVPLWKKKFDMESVLRTLAFEIVICNVDSYLVTSNNFILYEDLAADRFMMSSQDLDLTMGINILNPSIFFGGNWTEYPGVLTKPLTSRLMAVPGFKKELGRLILRYTKKLVNPKVLFPRIDQLYDMLKGEVEWDLNIQYSNNAKTFWSMAETEMKLANTTDSNSTSTDINTSNVFDICVNGETHIPIFMGLKEWIKLRSSNILTFFNQTL
ncbi:coth protein-domain-containing protein [Cokeromyces recurvatus]|uniref:coth protein-domain-containing protein n=1 Tax=Cokeromyces recurvatus TaxID=90255 RepID=UPI002220A727|nr:coth protein-domain-containing protein [Cokeromyces recurvatus]KAI7900522.1 coth protein-domain-containing protein [Cokeromyces recurvatus]